MTDTQHIASSSNDGNASRGLVVEREKKPVWGRICNGSNDGTSMVMGGLVSWPSLAESTKNFTKASTMRLTSSLGKLNPLPKKQRPTKLAGGGTCGGGVGTKFSTNCTPSSSSSSSSSSMSKISQNVMTHPIKGNSNQDGIPRKLHGGVDQMDRQSRHGDGRSGYHGNQRDRDHASHGWNSSRPMNGGDFRMQRGLSRQTIAQPPLPPVVPFVSHPPLQPLSSPMNSTDFSSQGYYFPANPYPQAFGTFPFVPQTVIPPINGPALFASTHQHRIPLLKQIEYYFSVDNLCKDEFLRMNMDEEGWVSVFLIATFKRVQLLTDSVQFILDVLRSSEVVEVQGNKIRRRNDWKKWILSLHQNHAGYVMPPAATYLPALVSLMENTGLKEKNVADGGDVSLKIY